LDQVAAVSVGFVAGKPVLDLHYGEDSNAEVDFNVVMTGSGRFVEIQGTAEKEVFSRERLDRMLALAENGIRPVMKAQTLALKSR
jgi:ribonuclease PH